jgi:hypothetical protein
MATMYARRIRRLYKDAANDPAPHQQNWSDMHQMRQDQIEAARGIFNGLVLAGALWAVMTACVFVAVWLLG